MLQRQPKFYCQSKNIFKTIFKKLKLEEKYLDKAVEIMKVFKDPGSNILKIEHYEKVEERNKQVLWIITEKCETNLKKKIEEQKGQLKQNDAIDIIKQILSGIKIFQEKQIIHRNLKPSNILVKNGTYKIADYTSGIIVNDMDERRQFEKIGAPLYCSPEMFFSDFYSSKSEIYSLGCIFYELIYGTLPNDAKDIACLINNLKNMKKFPIKCKEKNGSKEFVKKQIRRLIENMLQFDEEKRASWEEVFQLVDKRVNTITILNTNRHFQRFSEKSIIKLGEKAFEKLQQDEKLAISEKVFLYLKFFILKSKLAKNAQELLKQNIQEKKIELSQIVYKKIQYSLLVYEQSLLYNCKIILEAREWVKDIKNQEIRTKLENLNQMIEDFENKIEYESIKQFIDDQIDDEKLKVSYQTIYFIQKKSNQIKEEKQGWQEQLSKSDGEVKLDYLNYQIAFHSLFNQCHFYFPYQKNQKYEIKYLKYSLCINQFQDCYIIFPLLADAKKSLGLEIIFRRKPKLELKNIFRNKVKHNTEPKQKNDKIKAEY